MEIARIAEERLAELIARSWIIPDRRSGKTGQICATPALIIDHRQRLLIVTPDTLRRKFVVRPDRFTQAILSDRSRQYDREEVERWLTKGRALHSDSNGWSPSIWPSVDEAVSVCTRQMRNAGCYPETVLASVKSAVRQAAVSLVSELAAEILTRDAAQVCIAAYFDLSLSELRATPPRPLVSIPKGASTPGSSYQMVPENEPLRSERPAHGSFPFRSRQMLTR